MADRGRPTAPLVLTEEERLTLESLSSRRKTAQALALRARIVLACASGKKYTVVERRFGRLRILAQEEPTLGRGIVLQDASAASFL